MIATASHVIRKITQYFLKSIIDPLDSPNSHTNHKNHIKNNNNQKNPDVSTTADGFQITTPTPYRSDPAGLLREIQIQKGKKNRVSDLLAAAKAREGMEARVSGHASPFPHQVNPSPFIASLPRPAAALPAAPRPHHRVSLRKEKKKKSNSPNEWARSGPNTRRLSGPPAAPPAPSGIFRRLRTSSREVKKKKKKNRKKKRKAEENPKPQAPPPRVVFSSLLRRRRLLLHLSSSPVREGRGGGRA